MDISVCVLFYYVYCIPYVLCREMKWKILCQKIMRIKLLWRQNYTPAHFSSMSNESVGSVPKCLWLYNECMIQPCSLNNRFNFYFISAFNIVGVNIRFLFSSWMASLKNFLHTSLVSMTIIFFFNFNIFTLVILYLFLT